MSLRTAAFAGLLAAVHGDGCHVADVLHVTAADITPSAGGCKAGEWLYPSNAADADAAACASVVEEDDCYAVANDDGQPMCEYERPCTMETTAADGCYAFEPGRDDGACVMDLDESQCNAVMSPSGCFAWDFLFDDQEQQDAAASACTAAADEAACNDIMTTADENRPETGMCSYRRPERLCSYNLAGSIAIFGDLKFKERTAETIDLGPIARISGELVIKEVSGLHSFTAPNLEFCEEFEAKRPSPQLTTLSFPMLWGTRKFQVEDAMSITTIDLPEWSYPDTGELPEVKLEWVPALTRFSAPMATLDKVEVEGFADMIASLRACGSCVDEPARCEDMNDGTIDCAVHNDEAACYGARFGQDQGQDWAACWWQGGSTVCTVETAGQGSSCPLDVLPGTTLELKQDDDGACIFECKTTTCGITDWEEDMTSDQCTCFTECYQANPLCDATTKPTDAEMREYIAAGCRESDGEDEDTGMAPTAELEPRCNFGELMQVVNSAIANNDVAMLSANAVYQACSAVAGLIENVRIASACGGGSPQEADEGPPPCIADCYETTCGITVPPPLAAEQCACLAGCYQENPHCDDTTEPTHDEMEAFLAAECPREWG